MSSFDDVSKRASERNDSHAAEIESTSKIKIIKQNGQSCDSNREANAETSKVIDDKANCIMDGENIESWNESCPDWNEVYKPWLGLNELMPAAETINTYLPQLNESRSSYFKRVLKSMEQAANIGHFDLYEKIVNNICDPDVSWKSPNLPKFEGRANLVLQLKSIYKSIPDYVVHYDEPDIHHRLMSFHGYSEGTITGSTDTNGRLWDYLNYGFYDEYDDNFLEQMIKFNELRQANKPIRFFSQFTTHVILDANLQYIEKFVTTRRANLQIKGVEQVITDQA